MRVAASQRGFTIVETMIVLAITGVLFLVAFDALGGKQNETEFQQAINDAQSSIQHIIAEARTGAYQQVGNLQCTPGASTLSITSGGNPDINGDTGAGVAEEGACEFIGNVVQFAVQGSPQKYLTYPIMGASTNSGTLGGALPSDALPTAVAPGGAVNTNASDYSVSSYLHNGLTVECMGYFSVATNPLPSPLCNASGNLNGSNAVNVGAIGFISTLGNQSGGQLLSGSQNIWLVPVAGTSLGKSEGNTVDQIDGVPSISPSGLVLGTTVNPLTGVAICMASGTSNQSGLLTIGGNGGANLNAVTVTIFNGTDC